MSTAAVAASASLPTASVTRPCRRRPAPASSGPPRPPSGTPSGGARGGPRPRRPPSRPRPAFAKDSILSLFIFNLFNTIGRFSCHSCHSLPWYHRGGPAAPSRQSARGGIRGRRTGAIGATSVASREGPAWWCGGGGLGPPRIITGLGTPPLPSHVTPRAGTASTRRTGGNTPRLRRSRGPSGPSWSRRPRRGG